MHPEEIEKFCLKHGFRPTPEQAGKLAEYTDTLGKWNQKMNLVGAQNPRCILDDLIADSLYLYSFLNSLSLPKAPLSLDLGAGAGIPGIPLRIIWEPGTYYLIEIREKRVFFLRHVLRSLNLGDTHVLREKAQNLPGDLPGADIVISRAFQPLEKLLPLAENLIRPRGRVIIMANSEPQDTPPAWRTEAGLEYPAGHGFRYLSSLVPKSAPN